MEVGLVAWENDVDWVDTVSRALGTLVEIFLESGVSSFRANSIGITISAFGGDETFGLDC